MAVRIVSVISGSPAQKAGIRANDLLLEINRHVIHDVLDYQFYACEEKLEIKLERSTISICKDEYEDLGLVFESYLMDEKKRCSNKCIFCFIDQLPPGMRETLYFKDDDARLSFLQGNYITLTNLSDEDIDRIIKMHLKVNVSVHTTNPELRCKMTNNKNAGRALEYLYRIAKAGNELNCQLVLCPDYNDGDELRRSLNDLVALYPAVTSIACVPFGMTKYRDGLTPLKPFTKEGAADVVRIIEEFGDKCEAEFGNRLVYPSDEFFLLAEKPMPPAEYFGDFEQYENGVGMCASLSQEFYDALTDLEEADIADLNHDYSYSIATGTLAAPLLEELSQALNKKIASLPNYKGEISSKVYTIRNEFFGETITVAGLITGQDLIKQLSPSKNQLGNALLIPNTMLRADSNVFLDDTTVEDVAAALEVEVVPVVVEGYSLIEAVITNA